MSDEGVVVGAAEDTGGTAPEDDGAEATEVEWQFDALDLRPVERWLAALPARSYADVPTLTVLAKPTRRLVDRYLDTSDWRVGQAGFVLRTRQRGRAVEVTMKDRCPADPGGLRRRLELTESLPSGIASLGAGGPVGRRVHAVAGRRPLEQVLEVRTRRQPFSLRAAGAEVAEVALDDTTIVVGPHQAPARLRRVEVEVAPGWLDTLARVVQDLRESSGLSPAVLSKFEAGLLAAGLSVPGPPDVGPTDVLPHATLGDVAYAVIRRQVRELFVHEPGTRLGDDAEELHDMRVATRRLRAAMDIFATALPSRAAAVREELRWIAAELGAVRDLDVQLADMSQMGQWADDWVGAGHGTPLAHLRTLLETERDEARTRLLDALDSARWERLLAALVALARQGPSRRVPGARVPAALAVPSLLGQRHRAMRAAAKRARRSGVAHDFHRVRIRGKRLRYSVEFTSALYGQHALRFIRELTRLQDALGRMQDAEVASSRLFSLVTEPPPGGTTLPPATVFVMGGIAERYRQESAQLRRVMPERLKVLRAKAWQELEAAVERARRHAETAGTPPPYARPVRPAPAPATGSLNGDAPSAHVHLHAGTTDVAPSVTTSSSPEEAPDPRESDVRDGDAHDGGSVRSERSEVVAPGGSTGVQADDTPVPRADASSDAVAPTFDVAPGLNGSTTAGGDPDSPVST